MRPRGSTTRRGGGRAGAGADTGSDERAEPVGSQLRSAREQRGLDLLTVHDRLGRPITQLEALEVGNTTPFLDQAMAVSTLRRYATLLELDGDALAEQYAATWDTGGAGGGPAGTTVPVAGAVTANSGGPDHLRAFTETGEVPKVGGRLTPGSGSSSSYTSSVSTGPPTGTFPVVPREDLRKGRRSVARARRRLRAPTFLKVLTWTVASLVLVVAVGFVLMATNPRALANAHILRVVPAGSESATDGGSTGTGSRPAPPVAHQTFPVQPAGSTPSSASYTVATEKFTVVVAMSGACWVQVTSSSSPSPLLSGVQPAAKVLAFAAVGAMTVEVGSSAVLVGITIKGKNAFTDAPKVVPFTYTFTPSH